MVSSFGSWVPAKDCPSSEGMIDVRIFKHNNARKLGKSSNQGKECLDILACLVIGDGYYAWEGKSLLGPQSFFLVVELLQLFLSIVILFPQTQLNVDLTA